MPIVVTNQLRYRTNREDIMSISTITLRSLVLLGVLFFSACGSGGGGGGGGGNTLATGGDAVTTVNASSVATTDSGIADTDTFE